MSSFKLSIGAKLSISAGLGVLVAGAMVVNQQMSSNSVSHATGQIIERLNTTTRAAEIKATVRGLQIGLRDLRSAAVPDEVQKALDYLRARQDSLTTAIEALMKLLILQENRERVQKVKARLDEFAGVVKDIAAGKSELFEAAKKRQDNVNAWVKQYDTVLSAPALARSAKRPELETALRKATDAVASVRLNGWRYIATHETETLQKINDGLGQALSLIAQAREQADDRSFADSVAGLTTVVTDLKAIMQRQTGILQKEQAIINDRALPAGAEMADLVDKVGASAKETAERQLAASEAAMAFADRIGLAAGGAVLLILIGSAVFGAVAIAKPIRRIGEVLLELANGNKAVEIPYTGRTDEVGDNARAAQTFRDNLIRIEQAEAAQKEADARAAEEKRTAAEREAAQRRAAEEKAAAERKTAMQQLASDFEAAVGNIIDTVSSASTELEAAATTLTKTADTTQHLSGVVASASEEASANVQSVASAAEEMTGSVHEISRQVQESSRIAGEAVRQAEKTDARITELSQAANRIGDVVNLITSVAEQTNLLALNATIEAARAGEAGKGFAVVAQEVKALAAQTAKATGEIGTQISSMQAATDESVAAIKEIGETIRRVSEIAATIAAAVEEQGAATQEISRNVQQAAHGTAQVASSITDVNRGAGETGSASAQVLSSAQSLANESNLLKREVEKFLHTVRAA